MPSFANRLTCDLWCKLLSRSHLAASFCFKFAHHRPGGGRCPGRSSRYVSHDLLAPVPVGIRSFAAQCLMPEGPAPKIILSKKRLHETWSASRDAGSKPAAAGIDRQSATSFAQNLNSNITRLHQELMAGDFHFSRLKPAVIPKDNGKFRVICVPTVKDRLVQRAIANWLIDTKKFPHQEFVYGIKGEGLKRALDRALALRKSLQWCVKTDIQAFFDNINRDSLKSLVHKRLRNSTVEALIFSAIDREVRPTNLQQTQEIKQAGISPGKGIRQGMPLSPLLANIALTKFDGACKEQGIKILRYADDILGFFPDKADALTGFDLIKKALNELQLEVPELGSSKTELIPPPNAVSFLGREIVFLDTAGSYVSRVGEKKLVAIKKDLSKKYALQAVLDEVSTINEAIGSLVASMRSYLGSYKDAQNFAQFDSEIRHHFRAITSGWFAEIFGAAAVKNLAENHRVFLGMQSTDPLEPLDDLEITG